MLSFRTTKEVAVSLQKEETALLEFQYKCNIGIDGSMKIIVDAYSISGKDETEKVTLLGGQGSTRTKTAEELDALIEQVKPLTPVDENPLNYVYALIETGIKLIIVSEGLWKGVLTMDDFE